MDNDRVGFDGVKDAEGKPRNEDPSERLKLHRARFGVASDERYRSVSAADEAQPFASTPRFIPQSRLGHVVFGVAADDERKAHRNVFSSRSRTSGHGESADGFARCS